MITLNIYYRGENGATYEYMKEMIESGIVDEIKKEKGLLRYEFFVPVKEQGTILLVDSWDSQEALDAHHKSDVMNKIAALREKYNIHMDVERYVSEDVPESDKKFIV